LEYHYRYCFIMKGLSVYSMIGLMVVCQLSHTNAGPTADYASVVPVMANFNHASGVLKIDTQYANCNNCSYWCGLHDTEMKEGNAVQIPPDESFFKQELGIGSTEITNLNPDHIYIVECCRVTEFDIYDGALIHGGDRIAGPPTRIGEVDLKADRSDQMIPEPMGAQVRFHVDEIDARLDPVCEYRYCLINDHFQPCTHNRGFYLSAL